MEQGHCSTHSTPQVHVIQQSQHSTSAHKTAVTITQHTRQTARARQDAASPPPCCVLWVLRQPCPVVGAGLPQYPQHTTSGHNTKVTIAQHTRHTARATQDAANTHSSLLPCCVLCMLRQPCPVLRAGQVRYAQHTKSAQYTTVTCWQRGARTHIPINNHHMPQGNDIQQPNSPQPPKYTATTLPAALLCAVRAEAAMPSVWREAGSIRTTSHKCTLYSSHSRHKCPPHS